MAKASGVLSSHLFAALLLASVVLVKSLPTSVLVDSKQQQHQHQQQDQIERQPPSMSVYTPNKEKDAAIIAKGLTSLEHENPITVNKALTKFQKRGVKQNYFEPNPLNDIQFNNNMPAGVWDDSDNLYPDLNDFEDYQSYQPAFTSPYHLQRPYDNNFAQMLAPNNLYDEPRALPVKYQYPRLLDERRKRGINENIMRLKRDSTKLNTADMIKLLEFLERKPHNNHHNNNEIDDNMIALDYQKPFYGLPSYGQYGAYEPHNDNAVINDGEWFSDWIEPSVQYSGNSPPYGIFEQSPRNRYASKVFPAKRFMVAKNKRSLNAHSATDNASTKSKIATNFEHHFANNGQRF